MSKGQQLSLTGDEEDLEPEEGSEKPVKPDKYVLVDEEDPAYRILNETAQAFHEDELDGAQISLMWENNIKPDTDGHMVWGRAKKVQPLERKYHDHDFIIMLNKPVWDELPDAARRALMDHELCHCASKVDDKTGEISFYVRKHDLEGFNDEVRRHGLWRTNIESFVNAALKREQTPLSFPEAGAVSAELGLDERDGYGHANEDGEEPS